METFTPDIWPTFDDWWTLYDYKLDKRRCERLWAKMTQKEKERAMSHTERYTANTFTDGQFPSRRHPGTYLHNANWNDEALIRSEPRETALSRAAAKAAEYFANRRTFADGNA